MMTGVKKTLLVLAFATASLAAAAGPLQLHQRQDLHAATPVSFAGEITALRLSLPSGGNNGVHADVATLARPFHISTLTVLNADGIDVAHGVIADKVPAVPSRDSSVLHVTLTAPVSGSGGSISIVLDHAWAVHELRIEGMHADGGIAFDVLARVKAGVASVVFGDAVGARALQSSCCTITGSVLVSCAGCGSAITQIDLHGMGLTAINASAFTGLTRLTNLYLDSNQLTTLPAGLFTGLTSLSYLGLSGNQLTMLKNVGNAARATARN